MLLILDMYLIILDFFYQQNGSTVTHPLCRYKFYAKNYLCQYRKKKKISAKQISLSI